MHSKDRAPGRSVVLIDRYVASSIAEPDCWDYEFRIVGNGVSQPSTSFGLFAENDFETSAPIAAILSDPVTEHSEALAGAAATAWGEKQGGEIAKLVGMFTDREVNIEKNGAVPPRPYLFLVRRKVVGPDTLHQLATLSALQRCELDAWIDRLIREKLSLKIENENLHETLSDFQNVLWRVQDTRSLGYEIKIGDGLVALGPESLCQTLPVPTRGLTDIEFHLSRCTDRPFILDIELIEAETNTTLEQWSRSHRQVRKGWNRLSLPMALVGPRLTGMLRLTLKGGDAPLISMSNPTTVERAGARLGERYLGTPLALRLWQALPGSLNTAFQVSEDTYWEPLQRSTFANLSLAQRHDEKHERDFEVFAKEYPSFRLHPLTNQTLVAFVPVNADADTIAARVQVEVPDDRAQPIECAMAFLTEDGSTQFEIVEALESFSGWRIVQGGRGITIETYLDAEPFGLTHLCFAVRLSSEALGQDFSRTHWRSVELLKRQEGGELGPKRE